MSLNLALDGPIALAIYNWFASATGVTVVWAMQGADRLPTPFASLNFTSGPSRANSYDQVVQGNGDIATVTGWRQFVVSCQVFGPGALGKLSDALTALQKPTVQIAFEAASIAYASDQGIMNLTEVFELEFEERAQMDVTFLTTDTAVDTTGYVSQVNETGTLTKDDGSVVTSTQTIKL